MIMHLLGNLVAFVLGEGGGEADSMGREMEGSMQGTILREIRAQGNLGKRFGWHGLGQPSTEGGDLYLLNKRSAHTCCAYRVPY